MAQGAGEGTAGQLHGLSLLLITIVAELVVGLLLATTEGGLMLARVVAAFVMVAALFAIGLRKRGILFVFAAEQSCITGHAAEVRSSA